MDKNDDVTGENDYAQGVGDRADVFVGGIDPVTVKVVAGGYDHVVGWNAKWNLRDKFIRLKHSTNFDIKGLLRIIDLSMQITFDDTDYVKGFDTDEKTTARSTLKNTKLRARKIADPSSKLFRKAMLVLNERLNEDMKTSVERLTSEYNLRAPFFWVLADVIRFLAVVIKRKKVNMRKIKISPELALVMEKVWRRGSYFKYVITGDDVPDNMVVLMHKMLDLLGKSRIPKGKWKEPVLIEVKHPCFCTIAKQKIVDLIAQQRADLKTTIKNNGGVFKMEPLDVVREYIMTILTIENIISHHIEDIEKYYVSLAKNMNQILASLKVFLK
jgi:hypothetical protein